MKKEKYGRAIDEKLDETADNVILSFVQLRTYVKENHPEMLDEITKLLNKTNDSLNKTFVKHNKLQPLSGRIKIK